MFDLAADISTYELGGMNEEQYHAFFQKLIDTGLLWHLQGAYQRTATNLVLSGACAWKVR